MAARAGDLEMVALLLDLNADVNQCCTNAGEAPNA